MHSPYSKMSLTGDYSIEDILERLKAYEDTGLEPEDISMFQQICKWGLESEQNTLQTCEELNKELIAANTKIERLSELLEKAIKDLSQIADISQCDFCVHDAKDPHHNECENVRADLSCANFQWIHADEIKEVLNNG